MIHGARWCVGRLTLDAKQEAGRGQDSFETTLNAGVEVGAGSSCLVEIKQRLDFRLSHRPPIGPSRQRREDPPGAWLFRRSAVWPAREDFTAAGGLVAHSYGLIRAGKRPSRHRRISMI